MKIGLLDMLTIIFVIAKLNGNIAWSWWLVLAPSLAGLVIVCVLVMVLAVAKALE